MVAIVVSANILVQYPINTWLTWGALTYPIAFLVTDLCNRRLGIEAARQVVWLGFVVAVFLSAILATPRIAIASGSAFLMAQMLDVKLFDIVRNSRWYIAPLLSSVVGSLVDTAWFFSVAFYSTGVPWVKLAIGDYAIKVALALILLVPYRSLITVKNEQPRPL